jgi:hypothetical protein
MTLLNGTLNISIEKRPKLYKQMLEKPYNLTELNLNDLFIYLQTEKKNGYMKFIYYSEFLNIINTLVLFYFVGYNISKQKYVKLFLFVSLESIFLFSSICYYFLRKNRQNSKNRITLILLLFAFFTSIFFSEINKHNIKNYSDYLLKIKKYIKLNYILCSIFFLFTNNYYSDQTNSNLNKICYFCLGFIMSLLTFKIEKKIRIFLICINFFEFIPKIQKILIDNNSYKQNLIVYLIFLIWIFFNFIVMNVLYDFIVLLILNILFIIIYPLIFNYFYNKEKILLKGLWDLPGVTSYY